MLYEKRSCPICSCEDDRLYHQQRFSKQFDGSMLSGYDVVVCQSCGFGFADGIPSQAVLDQYYKNLSKYENSSQSGKGSSFDADRFHAIAGVILETLPTLQSSILEIGCATGELLGILRENGCENLLGLDPSPRCATIAKQLYGVSVKTGNIYELKEVGDKFNYVIMSAVMEHIRDLKGTLDMLRSVLEPEGRVILEVPDATQFAKYSDAPYQQFSTEHIDFFSPISLENLMGMNNFKQIYCKQFERVQSEGTIMPVVVGVYELADNYLYELKKDTETSLSLERYIAKSKKVDDAIQATIGQLIEKKPPIIVWGVGTHTLRLLEESRLNEGNIIAYIDSNPKYWGMELNGVKVLSPESAKDRPEAILISSRVHQKEIELFIRQKLMMHNEIITLYRI